MKVSEHDRLVLDADSRSARHSGLATIRRCPDSRPPARKKVHVEVDFPAQFGPDRPVVPLWDW